MNGENLGPRNLDRFGRLLDTHGVADDLNLVGLNCATILEEDGFSRYGPARGLLEE